MRSLIVVAALAASIAPAKADWQFTKWGMNVDEVIAASKSTAAATSDEERRGNKRGPMDALLKMRWQSGEYEFDVYFMFEAKTRKLEAVDARLKDPKLSHGLILDLTLKYGPPLSVDKRANSVAYLWRTSAMQVRFARFATGDGFLHYESLTNRNNEGL